ncbi:hypothetical protein BsWGS_23088 [Bradybaena similaris]
MAKDDNGHIANGPELNEENQHEKSVEGDALGSSTQETFGGCSTKKSGDDNIQLRTLMFSRSAETVGHLGVDPKQTGQRPDRLHARRPSTSRRGGAVEHNPSALRYALSKASCRNSKTCNIRTSKSCTKECEVLRGDYTNEHSTAYSTLYDDILRHAEESDTFTGFGEDGQGSDDDATLSESTSLTIDNGDVEVRSDVSVASRGCESCSPHCEFVSQSSTEGDRHHERPGACRCGPKIESSDEHLDSDASDRQQRKRQEAVEVREIFEMFKGWGKEDNVSITMTCSGKHQNVQLSFSEQSNAQLQIHQAKGTQVTSPFSAESTRNLRPPSCNDQSYHIHVSQAVNKDVSSAQPTASLPALNDDVMSRDMNTLSSGSCISRLDLDEDGKNTGHSLSKYEDCQVMNQLDNLLVPQSSSRVSLHPSRATPFSQCVSGKQPHASSQSSHQGRPRAGKEKRTPYPEELANAVTEAINAGEFHLSQIVTINQDAPECLLEENHVCIASVSNAEIGNCTESNGKTQMKDLSETATKKLTHDSPGISILSFNLMKEISDSAMPLRRDHNDVILGDDLAQGYAVSRVGSPLSALSELHTSTHRQIPISATSEVPTSTHKQTAQKGNSDDTQISATSELHTSTHRQTPISATSEVHTSTHRQAAQKGNCDDTQISATSEVHTSTHRQTPISATSDLHTSTHRQAAQKGSSDDSYPDSLQNATAPAKVMDTSPTCTAVPDENNDLSSFCTYPCIVEYPQLPNEFTLQNARLAAESLQAQALSKSPYEMEYAGDSCNSLANKDLDCNKPMLKPQETTGLRPGDAAADGTMNTCVSRSTAKGMIKSSVLPLGSHEYLTFLNKLRQEKPAKQETNRQQKLTKLQRKVAENAKKNTGLQEDDCHGEAESVAAARRGDAESVAATRLGDAESLAAAPVCPVGREVPADWKPGDHAQHPLTKLIANYTPGRKVKKRRSIRRKRRVQNRQSQMKKEKEVGTLEINRHVSNCEVNANSQAKPLEASKSCSIMNAYQPGITDTGGSPENDMTASFDYKRRYYERRNTLVKDDSGSDSKSDNSPIPKRVTSEVGLLKTLDELYSSDSSDEAEGELPFGDQLSFDVSHQTSLFNYYTRRLKHMSVLGNISQPGELAGSNMPYIRIRRVEQEVPSALDHKRLKSLYECRLKKPTLTSKIRKMDHFEQTRSRYNEKTEGVMRSGKQVHTAKGYARAVYQTHNLPQMCSSKNQGRDTPTDADEWDHSNFKERIVSLDKKKTTQAENTPHRSYLDILKSNINQPCPDTNMVTVEHSSGAGYSNSSKQKVLASESAVAKEYLRPRIDDYTQKTPPPKEREFPQRSRLKVRFADSCQENKDRSAYEMSEDDTWCSTVNAMLLRANRVMDDVSKNDHRYPKPDSARVVSPVPPKSPTFLKELLKQDTMERKQAKCYTKLERRCQDSFLKQDRPDARRSRSPKPVERVDAQGFSHDTVQPKSQAGYTLNNSSLVYSGPIREGAEQACVNEKSAGVLKISIQMSKQAQERAWLTHERLKRQRAAHAEIEMKSEMKTLPKKLTPLRISKPINFQNPDNRNLQRIPMRDVLSKTLMGMSTSSHQIFRQKTGSAEWSAAKGSNFLLDHHSETLRYFRGPYMHQRSSSIVPLFSDSNNNAYVKSDEEKDKSFEDNLDTNGRAKESRYGNQDVFASVHANDTTVQPESHDGRRSAEEQTSYNGHEAQVSGNCYNDAVNNTEYCNNACRRRKDQQSTENNTEYLHCRKVLQAVDAPIARRHSRTSNRLSDAESSSSKSFPGKQQVLTNTEDSLMSTGSADTQVPASFSKYIAVTIKPKEIYEGKIKSAADSLVTSDSGAHIAKGQSYKKVYISGVRCFENVENDRNLKAHGNNDDMEYKRSIDNEQMEAIEKQLETQETLLDALLGYEIERMSKAPLRMAGPDSKQSKLVYTGTEKHKDTSATTASVDDVSELCSTCYLNQWVPNYQDEAQETEQPLSAVPPEADQHGGQMRDNQVHARDISVHPCQQTSHHVDSPGFTKHLQAISFQRDPLDTAAETPDRRHKFYSQRLATRPKRHKFTDENLFVDNFAILGSTISLTDKLTQQIRTGFSTHKRLAPGQKALFPSENQHSLDVRKKQNQSLKSGRESDISRSLVVAVKSVGKPVKDVAMAHKQVTNVAKKYLLKQPATVVREDKRAQQTTKQPVKTTENLAIHSTQKLLLSVDATAGIEVEGDVSVNKTQCEKFDWASVKIPPCFTKGGYVPSDPNVQHNASKMDISKEYSTCSIYSTSTPAPNLEDKTADALDAMESSNCLHTPNIREVMTPNSFYSYCDPPNSRCTTANLKDVTNSVSSRLALCSLASLLQSNEEDTMDYSNTHQNTLEVYENISTRSCTSDVENECPTLSHTRMSPSSLDGLNTISQMSEWFNEDQDAEPAGLEAAYDALSWKSDTEKGAAKVAADGWEYKEWHAARHNLKLETACVDKTVHEPLRHTKSTDGKRSGTMNTSSELLGTNLIKTSSEPLGRDFLKTLRNTDLLHAVSMDRRRLLRSLRVMTRRHGYLPAFQVRSKQVIEMMPQIIVLNHCAKTFIERGSSSFSGTVRCLPIFYTEDNTGFVNSIYTVNWIPEGVYSLEKSTMEAANAGELRTFDSEQASFGKLLQYSPFASDLAFNNDQAYLIGDEVNSREEAAKTLTAAHDEAQGDVAKYFMLMCGWIPPHMNPATTLPTREAAFERNSDITESKEIDSTNIRQLGEEGQYVRHEIHLPAISVPTDHAHSDNKYSKVQRPEDPVPSLPYIAPIQLVVTSENPAVGPESHETKACKLPDICKSPGRAAPDTIRPTVMLCLRCGVTVECTQAQTDEVMQHTDESLSFLKRPAVRTYPTETNLRTSPERLSSKRGGRTNCHHSWEVTDVGLALPLLTATTCRSPNLFRAVKDRSVTQHPASFRKQLHLWRNRTTKSQTAFPRKNEFELSYSTLPRVKSQFDMHTPRGFFKYIDTPVNAIGRIQEYTPSNVQSVGMGTLPQSTSPKIQTQKIAERGHILIAADKGDNRVTADRGHSLIPVDKGNTIITEDKGNTLITPDRGNKLVITNRGNTLISEDRGNNLITADRGNNLITADKGNTLPEQGVKFGSYSIHSKTKTVTQIKDSNPRQRHKSSASLQKSPVSANNQKGVRQQSPFVIQTPVRPQAPLRQLALVKQNQQANETSQQTVSGTDKEKRREADRSVAGWSWLAAREATDEEQDLMVKRTWSQAVIPPPFPVSATAKPALKKNLQKSNNRRVNSSKAHLAKHRRNLNQINQSYISPYYAKKEIKRARSRTPVSDSGDDRSSISRITTISGLSSSSSESNTEEESSTEESECGSGSSASGSDFFTRYANKGGPTSVDDIFKRTLPRQKLELKLARLKEAKEKEEVEQLGYLRGREGATPPPQDQGDSVKNNEHTVSFAMSEYDMCSDAEEVKELWKQCFPEVDFWDTKRRRKFKKTKILS